MGLSEILSDETVFYSHTAKHRLKFDPRGHCALFNVEHSLKLVLHFSAVCVCVCV